MRVAICLLGITASQHSLAFAGGPEHTVSHPRLVGRAGVGLVSGDGAYALGTNPATLAKRDDVRLELATGIKTHRTVYVTSDSRLRQPCDQTLSPRRSPPIDTREPPRHFPSVALQGRLGAVHLAGAIAFAESRAERLPHPATADCPADVGRLLPHRYAALSGRYEREHLSFGAAMRVTDWLGVGASIQASRIHAASRRHIWAGSGLLAPLRDANADLTLSVEGTDNFVPGATAGVLVVPESLPVELAVSASYRGKAQLSGTARASADVFFSSASVAFPDENAASLTLPSHFTGRAGVRIRGSRWALETMLATTFHRGPLTPHWSYDLTVRSDSGVTGPLPAVQSLLSFAKSFRAGAALEWEAIPGFLWLTGGYRYASRGSHLAGVGTAMATLGTHTASLGAEFYWQRVGVFLGYAHSRTGTLFRGGTDGPLLTSPFVPAFETAAPGTHRATTDYLGLSLELSLSPTEL